MNNIRQAILKAADHIERNPRDFNFISVLVPWGCGTPGCALGWIGFYLGCEKGEIIENFTPHTRADSIVERLGLTCQSVFYSRLDALLPNSAWRQDAATCARAMRLYADHYFHEEKPALPASVRNIFDMSREQLREALEA